MVGAGLCGGAGSGGFRGRGVEGRCSVFVQGLALMVVYYV